MVIHTIINEYDLLYAQEREMQFVTAKPTAVKPFSSELSTEQPSLLPFGETSEVSTLKDKI